MEWFWVKDITIWGLSSVVVKARDLTIGLRLCICKRYCRVCKGVVEKNVVLAYWFWGVERARAHSKAASIEGTIASASSSVTGRP